MRAYIVQIAKVTLYKWYENTDLADTFGATLQALLCRLVMLVMLRTPKLYSKFD